MTQLGTDGVALYLKYQSIDHYGTWVQNQAGPYNTWADLDHVMNNMKQRADRRCLVPFVVTRLQALGVSSEEEIQALQDAVWTTDPQAGRDHVIAFINPEGRLEVYGPYTKTDAQSAVDDTLGGGVVLRLRTPE